MKKIWWRICARFHHRRASRLRRAAMESPSVREAQHYIQRAIRAARLSEKYFNRIKGIPS